MKSTVVPSQAYEVKLAPHLALFSLLKLTGHELLRRRYSDVLNAASDFRIHTATDTPSGV